MEIERRGYIGIAEDFAVRGTLVQKVKVDRYKDFQPEGDFLVIEDAPKIKFINDSELTMHINTIRIEVRGEEPTLTEVKEQIFPYQYVEVIGRFEIDR